MHEKIALGHNHQVLSRNRIRLHRLRNYALRQPVRVVPRRVPRVDAMVVRALQQRQGRGGVEAPGEPSGRAVRHGAENWVGDAEAGRPDGGVGYFGGRHSGWSRKIDDLMGCVDLVNAGGRGGGGYISIPSSARK